MISNIRKNIMGTISFDGLFTGMRKPQDFIVYPMHAGNNTAQARIQSDKRSGFISLVSGAVTLYPQKYFMGALAQVGALTQEELFMFKAHIAATASGNNSGALEVFK